MASHTRFLTVPKIAALGEQMRAFKARVLDGRRAADVAAELGMTDVAVWQAQSRVNKLIRQEFARLEAAGGGGG